MGCRLSTAIAGLLLSGFLIGAECRLAAEPEPTRNAAQLQKSGMENLEEVLHGAWGSGPTDLGLKMGEPGILPAAPFQGPGGFRVAGDGKIWISDSVNHRLIGLGYGSPQIVPIEARALGDLEILEGQAFVCTLEPHGITIIDLKAGKVLRHVPVPFKSPNRLMVCSPGRFAVGESRGGVWMVLDGKATMHPAGALEPVGNKDRLFGTLFDFDATSRKIISANWTGPEDEPALFSFFSSSGRRIVFSRLYGMFHGFPLLGTVTASAPKRLQFTVFDGEGKPQPLIDVPLLDGPPLPFPWIMHGKLLYGMSGDLSGYRIYRTKRETL